MQIKASRGPMLPATREHDSPRSATIKDSTGQRCPVEGRSALTDPAPGSPRMWRGAAVFGRLRLLADASSVGTPAVSGNPADGWSRTVSPPRHHPAPALALPGPTAKIRP